MTRTTCGARRSVAFGVTGFVGGVSGVVWVLAAVASSSRNRLLDFFEIPKKYLKYSLL